MSMTSVAWEIWVKRIGKDGAEKWIPIHDEDEPRFADRKKAQKVARKAARIRGAIEVDIIECRLMERINGEYLPGLGMEGDHEADLPDQGLRQGAG